MFIYGPPRPRPSPSLISVTKSRWTITYRETASLLDQLETVRKEKHEVEEARAMAAKQRVAQIEELVSENGNLKEEVRVLNERLRAQADEMGQVRREMSLVESSLFRANSEVGIGRNDWKLLFSLSVSSYFIGFGSLPIQIITFSFRLNPKLSSAALSSSSMQSSPTESGNPFLL